jgi:hypothetical protein
MPERTRVPCHQPTIQSVLGQQTSREDPFQSPRSDLRLHTGLEIPSPFHCSSGFALNLNASEKNLLLVLGVFTHALTQLELATKSSFVIVSVVNASAHQLVICACIISSTFQIIFPRGVLPLISIT